MTVVNITATTIDLAADGEEVRRRLTLREEVGLEPRQRDELPHRHRPVGAGGWSDEENHVVPLPERDAEAVTSLERQPEADRVGEPLEIERRDEPVGREVGHARELGGREDPDTAVPRATRRRPVGLPRRGSAFVWARGSTEYPRRLDCAPRNGRSLRSSCWSTVAKISKPGSLRRGEQEAIECLASAPVGSRPSRRLPGDILLPSGHIANEVDGFRAGGVREQDEVEHGIPRNHHDADLSLIDSPDLIGPRRSRDPGSRTDRRRSSPLRSRRRHGERRRARVEPW